MFLDLPATRCVLGPVRAAVSTRGFQFYNRKNTFLTRRKVERLGRRVHARCSEIGVWKVGQKCRVRVLHM